MSFPTTELINAWFQDAHTAAVAAGGSVYVMEKRAEHEVVSGVLRWVYLTMLDELEDLNYPNSSRVCIRVAEMLGELYTTDGVDDTEDDELVDDYNDEASLLPDEDEDEESSTEVEPTLALEVINALLKALIDKK
jgi:alkylated DNA repair dioxygenase AlkB